MPVLQLTDIQCPLKYLSWTWLAKFDCNLSSGPRISLTEDHCVSWRIFTCHKQCSETLAALIICQALSWKPSIENFHRGLKCSIHQCFQFQTQIIANFSISAWLSQQLWCAWLSQNKQLLFGMTVEIITIYIYLNWVQGQGKNSALVGYFSNKPKVYCLFLSMKVNSLDIKYWWLWLMS